ncbi:MAG: hypothetical protein H6567_05340 [Lewinellaceae bacterium]|nr:hypothetical protein [Lewinellaceae bacterium]
MNNRSRSSLKFKKSHDTVIHASSFVLAHKIGHGKFWLRHPNNDSNHLIPSALEGETSPGVGPYNYSDKNNFMYHTSVGRVNRIR